jgi:uncharacterized protein (DUF305 family)
MRIRTGAVASVIVLALAGAACGPGSDQSAASEAPRTVQPGAPGQESQVVTPQPATPPQHAAADVTFMQGMIHHHAQAVEMAGLLKTRSTNDAMQLLGKRIEVSQTDEIKMMRNWLLERGEDAPDPLADMAMPGMHHDMEMDKHMMPGMLTPEQMDQLAATKGVAFDKLFLELMIQHHEGALTMVKELMASPGAAQPSNIFEFTSDIVADQSAEIQRMRAMRGAMGK